MTNAVFVAPFCLEATARFVAAAASLDGVRLGLVTQDPADRVPAALAERLAAHWRVDDAMDPDAIVAGVRGVESRLGPVTRLVGTLEQLQVPLARARARLGLPGLSVEAAENFRDKARMKTLLREAGLPCARHRLASSSRDALAFADEVGFPIVWKPPAGAGAKATFRVHGRDDLAAALAEAPPAPGREVLLEEFVTGVEHSFDTASVDGRHVWHSLSRYDPTPLHVLENPWIQWCVLVPREIDSPRYDDIRTAAFRALDVLGMGTGVTHMEWFRRRDGSVAISEVAARPPGAQFCTLISYAHDVDFYRAWARLAVLSEFDPPPRRYAAGAAYLRGQGTGRVRAVRGLDQVAAELGSLVVEARIPREGQGPSGSYEGEGYVIVRHPETAVVERALRRIVEGVRVDLG
jgi:biotin carboxylase